MHPSTKLNSAIRALYKARAKECIVARGDKAQNDIDEQMKQIVEDIHSKPHVVALVAKLASARDTKTKAVETYEAAEMALSDATECEYNQKGEFMHFCYHTKTIGKARQQYAVLQSKRAKTIDCACHVKDSPEVLAFVADLSLVKTVGEADALLAKL